MDGKTHRLADTANANTERQMVEEKSSQLNVRTIIIIIIYTKKVHPHKATVNDKDDRGKQKKSVFYFSTTVFVVPATTGPGYDFPEGPGLCCIEYF